MPCRGPTMRSHILLPLTLLLLALLFPAAVPPAGALTIDIYPNQVCPGETVSIAITDLADQSTFNYTLTSTNLVSTGLQWYNLTSFNYPFAISDGRVYIVGNNVNLIKLETKIGGFTQSIQGVGPGTVTLNFPKNINAAVYDYYRINYEVTNTAVPVTITWIHNGTKSGPVDSTTTFGIDGASTGDVRCLVTVNGTVERDEVVTIVSCPLPPDPGGGGTTTPTSTPTATVTPTGTVTATPTGTVTSEVTATATGTGGPVGPIGTGGPGGTETTSGGEPGSSDGGGWKWEYQPPDVLKWLGQETQTAETYGIQVGDGDGGFLSWVVLFGIIVLIVAVILLVLMKRKDREEESGGR